MKKKSLHLFCICCIVSCIAAHAQSDAHSEKHHLLTELQTAKEDTAKVNLLNVISRHYYTKQAYDSSEYYAQAAFQLAQKLNYPKGLVAAGRNLGNYYAYRDDSANTVKYYHIALNNATHIGDKKSMALNLKDLGLFYSKKKNIDKTVSNYQKAAALAQSIPDTILLMNCYKDLGNAFANFLNYSEALEYYNKTLALSIQSKNKLYQCYIYHNLSTIYALTDSAKELKYDMKALELAQQIHNPGMVALTLGSLGYFYLNTGQTDKAEQIYLKSVDVSIKAGNYYNLAVAYGNLAFIYQNKNEFRKSVLYYNKSLSSSQKAGYQYGQQLYFKGMGWLIYKAPDSILHFLKIPLAQRDSIALYYEQKSYGIAQKMDSKEQQASCLSYIIDIYEKTGNYKKALEKASILMKLTFDLAGIKKQKAMVRKEMQFKFQEKEAAAKAEQEKKDIHQRTIRNTSIAAAVVLLLFLLLVVRQRNKVKEEKRRSDNLLLNILPGEVADELKAKGSAEAKQFDEVSILFTDFVGFTQTAEKLTPKQLVEELNECFTAFDQIMEKYGLEKIKTIGDAYLAVCGLPMADPEHAQKTVKAALEIRGFIEERTGKEKTFEIRIGVHSGSVVAGIVGVKKFAYDIWGDTVNTASRMESSGMPGKVNISETTYELVKNDFACEYRGEIAAKNKGKLKMYFVEENKI